MVNSGKLEDLQQVASYFAVSFEEAFKNINSSAFRLNTNLDLIEFFRQRVNELLRNYYPKEHILYQPLNRALFYSRRRLRATLAYCGSGIVGGIPESADSIAMAYEIITANYVLMDDSVILDAGTIRANMPTPRAEYGEVMALLSACTMQLEPMLLFPDHKQLKDIFYQSSSYTVIGWLLEHKLAQLSADTVIDENEILHTCQLLTGSLLAGALTSGAIISGGTPEQIKALYHYAMNFGCAYQLSDHIVDLMHISDKSGKDNFSDIETNKKNVVINHALQTLPIDSPQRKTIIDAIGTMPSASQKKELQRIFQDSQSIDHCLELVKKFSSQAISHLQKLPENQYRSLLERIPQMYMEELLKSMDYSQGK
ncbi:MAG: polyprenyl synthetase family protein [Calothrix sp. MO_167.B12]|nr:polyprenyl synthetase family protein [Calothrix sp. MO_167.B12]